MAYRLGSGVEFIAVAAQEYSFGRKFFAAFIASPQILGVTYLFHQLGIRLLCKL
jgi:hypothetical protein